MVQSQDMFRARVGLMKMLTALSDEALVYVWRPIAYAYYWTDGRDPDILTMEDVKRLKLLAEKAHASFEILDLLDAYRLTLSQSGLKRGGALRNE